MIQLLSHSSDPRPCYYGDVRAVNITYSNIMVNGEYLFVVEGAVEQCINGFIGPVCDIGWDDTDATAFCRRYQRGDYSKFLYCAPAKEGPWSVAPYFRFRLGFERWASHVGILGKPKRWMGV